MKFLKYSFIALILLLSLLVSVTYVTLMERYISEVEQVISSLVERPVKIDQLRVELIPAPHLHIEGVTVGAQGEIKLRSLEVSFHANSLLHRQCVINQVVIDHGVLTEGPVKELFDWLMSPVPEIQEPNYCQIERLEFRDFHLNLPDMPLDGVSGKVVFTPNNDPDSISLRIPLFNLSAEVRPKPDGTFHVEATTPGWAVPDIPDMQLEQIKAVGDISDTAFDIQELSARLIGITLHGKARLNWEPEWQLSGEVDLAGSKVRREIKALDSRAIGFGRLQGHGVFHSHGANPDQLVEHLAMDADVRSTDFSLQIDPQAKQALQLDQFNTHIAYTPDAIRLQKMDAKLAGGTLTGAMTLLPAPSIFRFDLSPKGVNPQPVVRAVDDGLLLSGVLDADVKGSINLDDLQDFPLESHVEGRFNITHGELGESKLVEAVNNNIPKAEEKKIQFDQIASDLLIDSTGYHLSKLKIVASVFNAEGHLNISSDEQLDGLLETDLKKTARLISLPLHISGNLDDPVVRPTAGAVAGAAIGTALLGPVGTAIGIKAGTLIERAMNNKPNAPTKATPQARPEWPQVLDSAQ